MRSFPIRVIEPDTNVIHALIYVDDKPVTPCGADSGKWPVQVGGDVECPKCLDVSSVPGLGL